MKTAKRTYALPANVIEKFEATVESGARSAMIATLVEKYLKEREKEEIRRSIEEGCRDMWDEYLEFAKQCEPMDAELDRATGM